MNNLLIIEDDPIVANIYRNKLTIEGYKVELAHDGETGLKLIQSSRPNAVLLDLMMPRLTGVEVLRAMRALPDSRTIPVIVFSNTYLTNMVQEAWKAGATKCLSKANSSPKQVIEAVRSVLQAAPAAGATAGPSVAQPASGPLPLSGTIPRAIEHATDPDTAFQADLRREFIETLPGVLSSLRQHLQALVKADSEMARLKHTQELYRRVHSLTSNAGIAGLVLIAQMADALEALLRELYEKPVNINASTLRTVAMGVDFLGYEFEHGVLPDRQGIPAANVLVVDDEPLSRRAVTYALDKAKLKSVSVENAETALLLLQENRFDLIFLDVDMPGMNGFDLCTRLRGLPAHHRTPVVFVTSLNDLESRAHSTMSGGNDFIAKPFLFIELAVRALIHVLRGKIDGARGALHVRQTAPS
jgi:DNA-binding response OmpR family regulator